MKRQLSVLILISCFSTSAWAFSGDPQAKMAQVAKNHDRFTDRMARIPSITPGLAEIPALLAEIRAVVDSTRIVEMTLRKQYTAGQEVELTRRLALLKKASGLRILHLQLKYARQEGRARLEKRILASIEELQRPVVPGGPRLDGRISPPPADRVAASPTGGSQP